MARGEVRRLCVGMRKRRGRSVPVSPIYHAGTVDGGDELTAQTNLRPVDVLRELDSADGSGVPEQTILQRVK